MHSNNALYDKIQVVQEKHCDTYNNSTIYEKKSDVSWEVRFQSSSFSSPCIVNHGWGLDLSMR